jgi:hypothetical protein
MIDHNKPDLTGLKGLSNRAKNCMASAALLNRESILRIFRSGQLGFVRNCGSKTQAEIALWLGEKTESEPHCVSCPHCGGAVEFEASFRVECVTQTSSGRRSTFVR